MTGVEDVGFVPRDYDTVLHDLQEKVRLQVGADIDVSNHSPIGGILATVAYEVAYMWAALEDVYYSGYVNYASGKSLDAIGQLVGIIRMSAHQSSGVVKFTRATGYNPEITIPMGTYVSTNNGIQYSTITSSTIPVGQMTTEVGVVARAHGSSGNVDAGRIIQIVSPVGGVTSVINDIKTKHGRDLEGDGVFRNRIQTYSGTTSATVQAIRSALLAVDGVQFANISENFATASFIAHVVGGDIAILNETLEGVRPCGVYGEISRPDSTSLNIVAQIRTVAGADIVFTIAKMVSNIGEMLSEKQLGEDTSYSDIIRVMLNTEFCDGVQNLTATAGGVTIDAFGETINLGGSSFLVPGVFDISTYP